MQKKAILLVIFSILLLNVINVNGTEKERPTYWEEAKIRILSKLDSCFEKGIAIAYEETGPDAEMQIMRGDVREIEYYYKYMCYGTKLTQKWGIDYISKWWYKPEGGLDPRSIEWLKMAGQYVVIDADSSYINKYKPIIIKKLYEFLDDEYPALQVSAARTLVYMGISDNLIIDKLEYYANGINSDKWNIEYTGYPDKNSIYWKGKTEQYRRMTCIQAIRKVAKAGLKILQNKIENKDKKKIETKDNNDKINNLNFKGRDLDWDGQASANYCIQYWGPDSTYYNSAYTNFASQGGDCCNFASQCLIAEYYEDIKAFLSFSYFGELEKGFDNSFREIKN
jgi:hypothetical protein